MKNSDSDQVLISQREYQEYQNLKLGKEYIDFNDEVKISALAEKVAKVLTSKGYLITQEEMNEYRQLKEVKEKGDELLSGVQVAKILHTSPATVSRLAGAGKLEFVRVGKVNKYTLRGIHIYLSKRKFTPVIGCYPPHCSI